jgi:hypothetical protein
MLLYIEGSRIPFRGKAASKVLFEGEKEKFALNIMCDSTLNQQLGRMSKTNFLGSLKSTVPTARWPLNSRAQFKPENVNSTFPCNTEVHSRFTYSKSAELEFSHFENHSLKRDPA